MSKTKPKSALLAKLVIAITGVILTWSLVVPAFETPDEQAHYGTASYLLKEGHLPGYHVPDMTEEMYQTQKYLGILRDGHGNNLYTYHPEHTVEYTDSLYGKYEQDIANLSQTGARSTYTDIEEAARYPALYYVFTAGFIKLGEAGSLLTRLFSARLGSVLIAGAMAYVVWQIGNLIFKNRQLSATLVAMTCLQPMMSFVSSGVNSDNLHNLLFAVVIYAGLCIIKNGFTWATILMATTALTLDLYTKPQAFIAILAIILASLMRIVIEKKYQLLIWLFFMVMAIVTLSWSQIMRYKGFLWVPNTHGAVLVDYLRFSLNKLLAQNVVWYWGVFKWLGVVLPPVYWRVANRVVLLSVVGLVVYFIKAVKKHKLPVSLLATFYLLLVTLVYAGVIFWFDWQYMKGWGFSLGIQARYFFPTLVAHMALMEIGIISLGWNVKSRLWLRRALLLLFLWLQLGGLWRLITVYYNTSSWHNFVIQVSQYKPFFAKGNWWYLWTGIYLASLSSLVISIFPKFKKK